MENQKDEAVTKGKPSEPLTEGQLFGRLKKRYAAPEYAIFPGVQNSTGYSRQRREADAIAMCLWPSMGMEVLGFEIKSQRSDWMRELRQPNKSQAIQKYCNRWWIVAADREMVKVDEGELPPTWGLMVPRGQGLVTVVDAPPLEPEPLDHGFIAAILRRAHEASQHPDIEQKIREELRPVIEKEMENRRDIELNRARRELEEAEKRLEKFEAVSEKFGLRYADWYIEDIAKAIKYLRTDGAERVLKELKRQKSILEDMEVEMTDAIEELQKEKVS